jgi:hypothetical protein
MSSVKIKSMIENERDAFKLLGSNTWVLHELILRNGQECISQPLPSRFKLRPQRACYWNAQRLIRKKSKLRYCEGYMSRPDLPLLINHAWAVDPEDRVIDPTLRAQGAHWSGSGEAGYFGIVFSRELMAQLKPRLGGPLLMDDWRYRLDRWNLIDPGLVVTITNQMNQTRTGPTGAGA